MKRVAVFGLGYVGCVTSGCLSRDGHDVVGVDVDEQKVAAVEQGIATVTEPGLSELVRQQVAASRLHATSSVRRAVDETDLAVIAVGTPSARDGSVDSTAVERVVESIGRELQQSPKPYTVVVRSTLLPGVLEDRLAGILEEQVGWALGREVILCNNPEFLRETTAIRDYDKPPFVIVGAADPADAESVLELYERIPGERIVTDTRTAALVKYACNAYHAVKVAFANEIGSLGQELGADGIRAMEILCRDRTLNISPAYLRPGFAFGGSCLPKDVRAMARFAQQSALRLDLISSILPSNDAHLQRAVHRIEQIGRRRIGMVGLSFKAGTDDLRESPQVRLAESLLGRGYDIRIYDPDVTVSRLRGANLAYVDRHLPHLAALLVETSEQLYEHAELLVLATDVADQLDWRLRFSDDVLDLRRDLVTAPKAEATV